MIVRNRIANHVDRARQELRRSFLDEYTAHQIAGSFALGAFITMLPTWGVGLLSFLVLAYVFQSINRIALFASVIVFNPVVKWGVYAASLALGMFLLGGVDPSSSAAQGLVVRLLVGNLILAVIATILSYLVVYWLVTRYRSGKHDLVEAVIDEIDSA